jgi:hypothetical protein
MCFASSPANCRSAHARVVAGQPRPRVVEHERQDELLAQAEHAEVGVAADLVEHALLARGQERELARAGERLRHERPPEVERPPRAHHVVEVPVDALRGLEGVCECVSVFHVRCLLDSQCGRAT